jgi:membrane protease YdiL (CAAX protease family)
MKASSRKMSPWPFFLLAIGWSWLFWIALIGLGFTITRTPGMVLLVIGGLGPPLAAISLTYLWGDKNERKDLWIRLIDFRRIPFTWYVIIFSIPPVYSLLAVITGFFVSGSLPHLESAARYIADPSSIIPFALATLIYGPVPEEIGWRGYGLDRLLGKWNALAASAVLGALWSLWHIPMFFMPGSLMSDVFPLLTTRFWIAMGPGIVAEAVIMTWIYIHTKRSILAAVLFHFMMNFTGEFLRLPGDFKNYQYVWLMLMAAGIIVYYGPHSFTREPGTANTG